MIAGNKSKKLRYNILVVDDDKVVSESLDDALDIVGIYNTTLAYSAAKALALITENIFDAYLVDQRMPEITGVEFIKSLLNMVDNPLIYMITAEDDGIGLRYAEMTEEEGGLPIKRYIPKPWPRSIFTVDLREDLRERDLVLDLTDMVSEHLKRQKEIQTKLDNSIKEFEQFEYKYGILINAVSDGVCSINLEGVVDFVNRSAEQIFQSDNNKIIGNSITDLLEDIPGNFGSKKQFSKKIETILKSNDTHRFETESTVDPSDLFCLEIATFPLILANNRLGSVFVMRDISERKKVEFDKKRKRLKDMHSARMMSIGELAASIAHELNQPLQTFKYGLHNIKKSVLTNNINNDALLKKMEKMDELSDFMATVIKNLRGYARPDKTAKMLPLREIIESVLNIMGKRLENNSVYVEFDSSIDITVYGNKSLLMQVFVNLLTNAMDAYNEQNTKKRKIITISTILQKANVKILIEDKAGGIPKKYKSRLFEPFVSGKTSNNGMGMGLYIVYEILKECNGTIDFTSKVNRGTTFTITLPLKSI